MKSGAARGLAVVLLVLLVLLSCTERASAYIPCFCNNPPEQCTCFIQLGDKGYAVERIIDVLCEKGYLQKPKKKNEFTPEVKQAVIRFQTEQGLECTGWMDDDTLNALLYDILPDLSTNESKPFKYTREFWDTICYVPTDGGEKHHDDPTCSDMLNPRMISRVNAMSLDIWPCRKKTCEQCSPLTYSALGLRPRDLPDDYYTDEEAADLLLTAEVSELPEDAATDRTLPDDAETVYIGNRNSHVFHRGSCPSVTDMNEKNKVPFASRDEAIENGYKPCSRCKP